MSVEIRHATSASDIEIVHRLFEDYAQWIQIDLSFQNFGEELKQLPGEYAPPTGVLLVAFADEAPAGCIAVRRLDEQSCEMKRLFVRDGCRGLGLGGQLARRAIDWARGAGYPRMRLDTLPSMGEAQKLYARLGFVETPAYRFNPVEGARFMSLDLRDPAPSR